MHEAVENTSPPEVFDLVPQETKHKIHFFFFLRKNNSIKQDYVEETKHRHSSRLPSSNGKGVIFAHMNTTKKNSHTSPRKPFGWTLVINIFFYLSTALASSRTNQPQRRPSLDESLNWPPKTSSTGQHQRTILVIQKQRVLATVIYTRIFTLHRLGR